MIVKGVDIDLVIIFIVYFHASNRSSAGIFAFCQGFLLDILSGGVQGLFTFLYLLVYLTIRITSHPIDLLSTGGRTAVVFIAVMVKELLMILLFSIFSLEFSFSVYSLLKFCLSAILTSILSVIIFQFLNITDDIVSPVGGNI